MTRVIDAVLDFFSNLFRSYKLECIEELVTAIAIMHNIMRTGGNTNLTVPGSFCNA
jgi:hypothetical protein